MERFIKSISLTDFLENKFHGSDVGIEKLSDLLWQIGKLKNNKYYCEKAIFALEYLDANSSEYSMARAQKLDAMRKSFN